jgi:hypothetical protein
VSRTPVDELGGLVLSVDPWDSLLLGCVLLGHLELHGVPLPVVLEHVLVLHVVEVLATRLVLRVLFGHDVVVLYRLSRVLVGDRLRVGLVIIIIIRTLTLTYVLLLLLFWIVIIKRSGLVFSILPWHYLSVRWLNGLSVSHCLLSWFIIIFRIVNRGMTVGKCIRCILLVSFWHLILVYLTSFFIRKTLFTWRVLSLLRWSWLSIDLVVSIILILIPGVSLWTMSISIFHLSHIRRLTSLLFKWGTHSRGNILLRWWIVVVRPNVIKLTLRFAPPHIAPLTSPTHSTHFLCLIVLLVLIWIFIVPFR